MRKWSGRWYRFSDDVISVCELQKSQYGPTYYLNVAFWLRTYGDPDAPREAQCHVRCRLETLFVEDSDRIGELLDLGAPLDDNTRTDQLAGYLETRLLPFLDRGASIEGLKMMRADGTLAHAGLRREAVDTLATE